MTDRAYFLVAGVELAVVLGAVWLFCLRGARG